MKWEGRRKSENVSDRRGMASPRGAVGLGGAGLIVVIVFFLLTGQVPDLGGLLGGTDTAPQTQSANYTPTKQEQALYDYAAVVLADIEDTWNKVLPEYGKRYEPATLVVYSGVTQSGCGTANSGVGPFYCTRDHSIYLDLSFYDTLTSRYGAKKGDFAMSYVIAHEAGHHVQTLLGVTDQMTQVRQAAQAGQISQKQMNQYLIRYELQADYLAGVVARFMKDKGYLDEGDIDEALSAAAAVGDDAIQKKMQGYADPDTFNHGTAAQRQKWYQIGFKAGDLSEWDTFNNE